MKPKVLQLLEAAAKGEEMASNVTVNGEPLKAFIDAEKRREIEESKPNIKLNRQIVSKHNGNQSRARTSPGEVIWTAGQKATHIRFRGQEFKWLDKAPYVMSGLSTLGALEICEGTGEIKCHECGEWFEKMSCHVRKHKLTTREYKMRHGLAIKTSINSPKIQRTARAVFAYRQKPAPIGSGFNEASVRTVERRKEIVKASPNSAIIRCSETLNLRGHCEAQRVKDLKNYAALLGRTPSVNDLLAYRNEDGRNTLEPSSLRRLFGTSSLHPVMMRAGLKPRQSGKWIDESAMLSNSKTLGKTYRSTSTQFKVGHVANPWGVKGKPDNVA